MSDDDIAGLLKSLGSGNTLSESGATALFTAMMQGTMPPSRIAAVLTAMAVRKLSIAEIAGGARALRAHMVKVVAPAGAIDLVGTGGDGQGTLNISSAAAIVVAACGVPVAKHGNRAMSSLTGAADVLEELGVTLDGGAEAAERALKEAGLTFLFAQAHHPAMRHVAGVRKELGFRTVFNLLGPLSNPAGVKRQLLGVYGQELLEPVAQTLLALGAEKAWVVHGSDRLDEITITGPTYVAAVENGAIKRFTVAPEDAGLSPAPLSAIKGGSRKENAEAIKRLLKGEHSAYRDIVLLNAAAALVIADRAANLREGAGLAASAIDNGAAARTLEKLIAATKVTA